MIQHYAGADTKDYEDMLFHDPSADATFWSSYPLAYRASGTGLVTARADWNYDSTWLSFQLGNLLSPDHQTYAPGQLQIQRGGDDLAGAAGSDRTSTAGGYTSLPAPCNRSSSSAIGFMASMTN